MRILNPSSGPGPPGSDWNSSSPRFNLAHGLFDNLCTVICSCFYVFCCCWFLEDCCMGRRSFPGPRYGSFEPPPPPPPHVGPAHQGLLGSVFGPIHQPGQPDYPPGQPGPSAYHTGHYQAGPPGYPGEPTPF